MKRFLCIFLVVFLCVSITGCKPNTDMQVVATTAPMYEFAARICNGTDIKVGCIITENVSCLHDYTLQTKQVQMIENAEVIILSGAGLEDFLLDLLNQSGTIIDGSASIELLCSESGNDHHGDDHNHHHEYDPHIWLSPANARQMAQNICDGLQRLYPQYADQFNNNLQELLTELTELESYGNKQLEPLSNRQLVTFHDGFAYLAEAFNMEILHAIEEESGSEASAKELIEICQLIEINKIPAIFTEQNGSVSAADIISAETGSPIYQLDMAMSGDGYIQAMYHNIDTLKEALG